ncbi:hypothetical protein SDC9_18618 [bioreactor metagenome]|uniref:Uncharacterized protein n=1 Tax=bioreactor metagenome TaxID=1076179 RepID=A0A644U2A0_9ZZZZ
MYDYANKTFKSKLVELKNKEINYIFKLRIDEKVFFN